MNTNQSALSRLIELAKSATAPISEIWIEGEKELKQAALEIKESTACCLVRQVAHGRYIVLIFHPGYADSAIGYFFQAKYFEAEKLE